MMRNRLFHCLLFIISWSGATLAVAASMKADREVVVFYSGDIHGTIEPCGCTSDPLGDLARLTYVLRNHTRRNTDVLFLDAGNLSYPKQVQTQRKTAEARLRAAFLGREWERLTPLGCGLGENDLLEGKELLPPKRLATNVEPDPRIHTVRRSTVGGIGFGVIGYVDPEVAKAIGLVPLDAERALSSAVKKLRLEGAEVIFLLAPVKRPLARVLARTTGVDFVILGKDVGEGLDKAEKVENAYILAPGEETMRLGKLTLTLRNKPGEPLIIKDAGSPEQAQARLAQLNRTITKLRLDLKTWQTDPATDPVFLVAKVRELATLEQEQASLNLTPFAPPSEGSYFTNRLLPIQRHLPRDPALAQSMRKLDLAIGKASLSLAEPPPPADKGQAHFVGDAKCVSCHKASARHYLTTRHAKAWRTLVEVGKTGQEDCVSCHVTGFGEMGGSSFGFTKGLQNVQCETCHGAGSIHVEKRGKETPFAGRLKTPESICVRCHNEKHSDTFEYKAYLRDVIGPGHGEEARDALGDGPTGKELRQRAKRLAKPEAKH